ncbi:MAG: DUF4097 family beta strand repeat-containing protein [Actinomycetota bacterium]|nr:DUF4097 family beta strand repeat-containing protein [Actinomycetota bacterium]
MTHWEITEPQTIELDTVSSLRLRIVEGDVSVTATDGPARLEVHSLTGAPLQVDQVDGVLTVTYKDLSWGGILDWITGGGSRKRNVSLAVAVPADCAVELGTVSADAVVSGVTRPTNVRTVSGEITLDGLGGDISARTVSGNVESLGLAGELSFETVSGDLTVASGTCSKLMAKTVSGDVMVSVEVESGGRVAVVTVSGDVVLRLPAATAGASVRVDSVSGQLTSAFDGVTTSRTPGRRRLEGVVGDGRGALRVKTVSGDVDLLSSAS